MKAWNRGSGIPLADLLKELQIGDEPIIDSSSGFKIIRVFGGFLYFNEYEGVQFVPYVDGGFANRIVTKEPEVKRGRPPKTEK